MRVEDPAGECCQHGGSDDAHVPGEDDDIGLDRDESGGQGPVVAARDQRRLEPLLDRPIEGRARPVGEDEGDRAAQLVA